MCLSIGEHRILFMFLLFNIYFFSIIQRFCSMKRLYIVIAMLVFGNCIFAQKLDQIELNRQVIKFDNIPGSVPVDISVQNTTIITSEKNKNKLLGGGLDTMNNFLNRSTGFTSYLIDIGGNITPLTGWNPGYLFIGQKCNINGNGKVTELLFAAQQKIQRGVSIDSIAGLIFSADQNNGLPTNALGAAKIAFDKIDTNIDHPVYTSIKFEKPIEVNTRFVSMLYTNNFTNEYDAVMLYTNFQGDGQNAKEACLIYMDMNNNLLASNFMDFWAALGVNMPDGNPPNFDVLIFPIVDDGTSGVESGQTISGITVKSISPQPANDFVTLELNLEKAGRVVIDLVDLSGNVVQTVSQENCASGGNTFRFNVSEVPSGTYYYLVRTNYTKFGGKLNVVK